MTPRFPVPARWVIGLSALSCAACATSRPAPSEPYPTADLELGVHRVADATHISQDDLRAALKSAEIVIVAESHDSVADHNLQLRVFEWLADDRQCALGMEMFQRPFQGALDRFTSGQIDEQQLLVETEWEDRWGFDPALYRDLWNAARRRNLPIIALNVRRELTKRVSANGLDGLTDAERADVPEMDLESDRYRDWMKGIFAAHGAEMPADKFERFFQAQILWDETMADSAARALGVRAPCIVVVVGRGHVERDFGIPTRARRRLGAQHGDGRVISIVPTEPRAPEQSWMQRERFADYVWVREP